MTKNLLQNWFLKDSLLWFVNDLAANDSLEPRHSRFLASFCQKEGVNPLAPVGLPIGDKGFPDRS